MKIPALNESYIREHAASGSYERGSDYRDDGAVLSLRRTSTGTVDALVKGSQYAPYSVRIRHDDKAITSVECSCPYFAGAWCKHVVAALLSCLDEEAAHLLETASQLAKHLNREELAELLDRVSEKHPELLAWIRAELAAH